MVVISQLQMWVMDMKKKVRYRKNIQKTNDSEQN